MRVKFIFKEPKVKAQDGAMSERQLDRDSIQEQIYYYDDVIYDYERRGRGSEEDYNLAKERIQVYKNMLDEDIEDFKAEDMPVSSRPKDILEPSLMREIVSDVRRFLRRNIPVMLSGVSGFGKSELSKQAAVSIPGFPVKRENVLDIRAGMMNVEDLKGIPMLVKDEDPEKAFTQSTIPGWLKKVILSPDENFVLFFDEINHATAPVLNSLYGIILERQLDEFKFGDRTRIIAAGNKADENEDLTELSTPLRNRLEIISIDKAVGNDPAFFQDYLYNKYVEGSKEGGNIPPEILKTLFREDEELSNARAIEILLRAWVEDIRDGEDRLTRSGAIPASLYMKIQKLYKKKYLNATGSQGHKEVLNQVTDYIKGLYEKAPQYFTADLLGYRAVDLIEGNYKPSSVKGVGFTLSEEGKAHVREKFNGAAEEIIETAFDKIARG